jgi:hypothetical protein
MIRTRSTYLITFQQVHLPRCFKIRTISAYFVSLEQVPTMALAARLVELHGRSRAGNAQFEHACIKQPRCRSGSIVGSLDCRANGETSDMPVRLPVKLWADIEPIPQRAAPVTTEARHLSLADRVAIAPTPAKYARPPLFGAYAHRVRSACLLDKELRSNLPRAPSTRTLRPSVEHSQSAPHATIFRRYSPPDPCSLKPQALPHPNRAPFGPGQSPDNLHTHGPEIRSPIR